MGIWRRQTPPGEQTDLVIVPGFVRALETLGTANALAALRALSAVEAPSARDAADRLAAGGVPEPAWGDALGRTAPVAAALLEEPAFDDGVSVLLEFAEPGSEFHTLSVYIDHNLGGLVKDVFLAGRLAEVRTTLAGAPESDRLAFRTLELDEARARVEAALDMLDHTIDPPVSEDVYAMRALIDARVRMLPSGFELPKTSVEVTLEERDALLEDFLSSPEGRLWRGDDNAEYAARLAIDFGADYNHGGPLRWSAGWSRSSCWTGWRGRSRRSPTFFRARPRGAGHLGALCRPPARSAGRRVARGGRGRRGVPPRSCSTASRIRKRGARRRCSPQRRWRPEST